MNAAYTDIPEYKGIMAHNQSKADDFMAEGLRGFIERSHESWGGHRKICIDKNRLWNGQHYVLNHLYPEAKMILMVRDLKEVFASYHHAWLRNPLIDIPPGNTLEDKMKSAFSDNGVIGAAFNGVQDVLLNNLEKKGKALFVRYEDFVDTPLEQLGLAAQFLGLKRYEHDVKNVKNTAIDPDWLYLGRFPHKGAGKIQRQPSRLRYCPKPLQDHIDQQYHPFRVRFDYV
ncbi:MAG: sulfotransferase domain-containing protein [Geminicoccaceae bacterium]